MEPAQAFIDVWDSVFGVFGFCAVAGGQLQAVSVIGDYFMGIPFGSHDEQYDPSIRESFDFEKGLFPTMDHCGGLINDVCLDIAA